MYLKNSYNDKWKMLLLLLGEQCSDGCFRSERWLGKSQALEDHTLCELRVFGKTLGFIRDQITKMINLESIAVTKNGPGIGSNDRSFARSVVISRSYFFCFLGRLCFVIFALSVPGVPSLSYTSFRYSLL